MSGEQHVAGDVLDQDVFGGKLLGSLERTQAILNIYPNSGPETHSLIWKYEKP